jgi:hypothetical protein
MADIVFIAVISTFFGLCVLYIRACDRLVQSTEDPVDVPSTEVTS